ncbi:hypothetical protein, partial [Gottfriedia acidiceleris]|uniref:hypothetical protein n=1 Tax=Gottfriedia acidiceleris TaxID=371036 RepID=UPI003D224906
ATGATGATGEANNTPFAYINSTTDQTIAHNGFVEWQNNVISQPPGGIVINPGDNTDITIPVAGFYLIHAFTNYNGSGSFILELNGAEVPSTLYQQNDGTTMTLILNISVVPAHLRLKNKGVMNTITSDTIDGVNSVSAGITIFKIG